MVSDPAKSKRSKKSGDAKQGDAKKEEAKESRAPSAPKVTQAAAPPARSAPLFASTTAETTKEYERIVRPAAEFNKHTSVQEQLQNGLSYGPAPEADDGARAWFASHDGELGLFINNEWKKGQGRRTRDSVCPANGEVLVRTTDGNEADVDAAVAAAKAAHVSWSALSGHERAKHLYSIARHVQKHHRLLAVVEALDNGKSIRETRDADVALVARHFYHHAGWAQVVEDEYPDWTGLGVICEIVPWNFPIMLLAWKVCPALATGNTIVLKPASYTRLSALLFAEICAEAGLPPGVLNIVTGSGAIGSKIADHPDVAKIAFTGSTPVGRLLRQRIAGSGKKISLELGGKSPVIVYDTADIDSAVEGVVDAIYFNQGQVCCAGSRLIVQESIADDFVRRLKNRIDTFRIGHPLDKAIDMGALVDESQYTTIQRYLDMAREEGANVYVARTPVPDNGYFYPPVIITNIQPVSRCVQEEIFGPVLTVLTFRSPEEAIALANNTCFGLGGSCFTENISLALETAISVKCGAFWVNAHNLFDAAAGFGGYRESGFGRDGGREGLFEYMKPAWKKRPKVSLTFPTTKEEYPSQVFPVPSPVKNSAMPRLRGVPIIDKTHKMYVGGKQKRPDHAYSSQVFGHDGSVLAQVGDGNRKDVRDAVAAAAKAQPGWGKRAAHNRAQICFYIAENLTERYTEFAERIAAMTGCSMQEAEKEVDLSIERLFYYAAYADKYGGLVKETTLYGVVTSINEPVGVVGAFCPDERPLLGFVSLLAPLLVRGNAVVIFPSPKYPLSGVDLYEVFETSDLPAGVVNVITGNREVLVKTIAQHDDVDGVWYFGTQEGSRNVEYASAQNMKRSWVDYGEPRDWADRKQGQGLEFLRESVEVKHIQVPFGECK